MIDLTVLRPSEYKLLLSKGPFIVSFGHYKSILGTWSIGLVKEKICHLSYAENREYSDTLNVLNEEWPGAVFKKQEKVIELVGKKIFQDGRKSFRVLARGTEFQEDVWRGLLKIPEGETWSYAEVASSIGRPKAVRAAANAVATNFIGFLIPCHRVIKKSGEIHRYQRKIELGVIKEKILNWEKKKINS